MPVSGSANPNEPPAPGHPNARSDEPNTNVGRRLAEPERVRRVDVHHLVAHPHRRWHRGALQCLADGGAQANFGSTGCGAPIELGDRPRGSHAVHAGHLEHSQLVTVQLVEFLDVCSEGRGTPDQAERTDERGRGAGRHCVEMQQRVALGERVYLRHTVAVHRRWQPDIEVQVEWRCDLLGEVSAKRAPLGVCVTDEFGLIPAESDRVVAMPGAGRPQGSLSRNPFR